MLAHQNTTCSSVLNGPGTSAIRRARWPWPR